MAFARFARIVSRASRLAVRPRAACGLNRARAPRGLRFSALERRSNIRAPASFFHSRQLRVRASAGSPSFPRAPFARAFCSKVEQDAETIDAKVDPKMDLDLDEDELDDVETSAPPEAKESKTGSTESLGFQAETRRILDIVANSLYTDKEVFLRELISNASDALEKARYLSQTEATIVDSERDFEIHITCDKDKNQLIVQDSGIGMTREELIKNLGTIARSGSKEFINTVDGLGSAAAAENIIGQFGVGFYSVFMVADKVEVFSQSADANAGPANYWSSTGDGSYDVGEASEVVRGTKIILHLKEAEKTYADKNNLENIIDKYSNFVGFPIYLNTKKLNTVQAIWTLPKNEVTERQHEEFYRYISSSFDTPRYTLHFSTDVPIQIYSIFYVPDSHTEKYGMARMEPGVSLYSRKVLITPKSKLLLPEWLRFVKGVVDSEDIPLNISRENMQDSALIRRMNNVLTKKMISYFADEAKRDPEKYLSFYNEFDTFLKEGVCTDYVNKEKIARLLRYQTSLDQEGLAKQQSLDDYVSRMAVGQKAIYYLCAPNRDSALSSPYMETFKKNGTEVLFLYQPIDEFVMKNLGQFNGRKLLSIESSQAEAEHDDLQDKQKNPIADNLVQYFSNALASRVSQVTATERLVDSPAVIVDHESAHYRRMMKMMEQKDLAMPKQKLQINPEHEIMIKLHAIRNDSPEVAQLVADQIFDNALIAADILDNPRDMIPRLNKILSTSMDTIAIEDVADTAGEPEEPIVEVVDEQK